MFAVGAQSAEYDPPMYAASSGQTHIAHPHLLIAHGANINARSSGGKTALTLAQEKKHRDMVKLLKMAGAKP
ncbi:MAG: ankyrin repeat domain-containing protein [Candidatus Lindowbacteria bacterium]|nr:ankyrin repeat domain-containing protein [Candidatus Lindowbacteria bacterium]